MATTVKQILEWPMKHEGGKFTLIAKTIKKRTAINEKQESQRLILTDGADDILAELPVRRNYRIIGDTPIHVVAAIRDERDVNNRMVPALIISRWYVDYPPQTSAPEDFGLSEQWKEDIKTIRSKCKFGLVKEFRARYGFDEKLSDREKEVMDSDIDEYILPR